MTTYSKTPPSQMAFSSKICTYRKNRETPFFITSVMQRIDPDRHRLQGSILCIIYNIFIFYFDLPDTFSEFPEPELHKKTYGFFDSTAVVPLLYTKTVTVVSFSCSSSFPSLLPNIVLQNASFLHSFSP